jgi:hypothetical protein
MRQQFLRLQEVHRMRVRLERDGFPRIQMFLLVTITGAAGFISLYAFLHLGLSEMWIRYPLSVCIAYLIFLVLLWLWLRTRAEDYLDVPDLSDLCPSSGGSDSTGITFSGQGGGFDGGGASGSFDVGDEVVSCATEADSPVGDALGAAAEADEFAIPVVVVVLVAAMVLSSLFFIYSAPLLFAELLVDGVLAASLYRRLRGIESRHWLETALRRTFLPFAFTALAAAAGGWAMALYAPEAHSIGGVLLHAGRAD